MKGGTATHKNGDDSGVQGVTLTMSDGQVFWSVYVSVSVTCCHHTGQTESMSDSPLVTITSKFYDKIYC